MSDTEEPKDHEVTRVLQHIIDTRTVKRVMQLTPDHWVIRDLSERDYGIDLQIEIFTEAPLKPDKKVRYSSTGCIAHLQLKGTGSPLHFSADNHIHFSMDIRTLKYAERFPTPFFLLRVDVSGPDQPSYFLWLQRYIADVLDVSRPNWRTLDQETIVVKIPAHNPVTEDRLQKIEDICARPKYLEELLEFSENYRTLQNQLDAFSGGEHPTTEAIHQFQIGLARRLTRLSMFFKHNPYGIYPETAEQLLKIVESLDITDTAAPEWVNFSGREHLERFLQSPITQLSDESFMAEVEGDTPY